MVAEVTAIHPGYVGQMDVLGMWRVAGRGGAGFDEAILESRATDIPARG